ncbi:ComF family protein [Gordonibacter sp.]|uniref:ComF family protein n=1 Tax=Gordonibacter sp. TaxID=1968902 RepID=UPI002FCBFBE3
MPTATDIIRSYAAGAAESLAETLWPTRCAVCDAPGDVLCVPCLRRLSYVDWWRACPHCGAPFGSVQCSECNPVSLARSGRTTLPYDGNASAVVFDEQAARIVRTYKDQGERRLANSMALLMMRAVPPAWNPNALAFVPASSSARRRRGFDHGELLARTVASQLELPLANVFVRPRTRDQRTLSRQARWSNTKGRFEVLPGATVPAYILLIDDVYTTGATLFEATDALRRAGAERVWCLTFARVW